MMKISMIGRTSAALVVSGSLLAVTPGFARAWQDSSTQPTPYGVLTANAYYDGGTDSGGARKWNYAVSAKVDGSQSVELIKTTWTGGADMRNSASFSVTAGADSVSAGGGSSWTWVHQTKYWSNNNGARTSSYSSNMVAMPRADYRFGTVALSNTAYVKFRGDPRNWQITAAC